VTRRQGRKQPVAATPKAPVTAKQMLDRAQFNLDLATQQLVEAWADGEYTFSPEVALRLNRLSAISALVDDLREEIRS